SMGSGIGSRGVVPAAVGGDQGVRFFRSPAPAPVWPHAMMLRQDRIDRGPGRLDGVFTRKQRAIADHRVAQESLVRFLFARLFVDQVELSLHADELLAG